jgi:hypothetical protein
MKTFTFSLLFLALHLSVTAQNDIAWDGKYQLQFSDFKSPATKIGEGDMYSLRTGATFDFAFQMSNGEFMFTKNFNSKVSCEFKRNVAALIAPDSARATDLLLFSRLDFDMAELYARKCRQKLYETKGTFSNANFFQPIFDQFQNEYAERHASAAKATDLGHNREKLAELHNEVLDEIKLLSDFCKECKPPKKKKK